MSRLRFPVTYREKKRKWLIYTSCFVIATAYLVNFTSILLELPLDLISDRTCTTMTCLLVKGKGRVQFYIKISFSSMILVSSYYLFLLLRKKKIINIKNRVVKYTVIGEICLSILPSVFSLAFNTITGDNLINYAGQSVGTLSTIDVAICSVLYFKMFAKEE
uniref:Uncharacterized protein n=1 Tax=Ditylenchus dipsaci TaxID=166011 RepID=A0A915E619_9BILA